MVELLPGLHPSGRGEELSSLRHVLVEGRRHKIRLPPAERSDPLAPVGSYRLPHPLVGVGVARVGTGVETVLYLVCARESNVIQKGRLVFDKFRLRSDEG